jgi:hypothetical protein
MFLLSTLLFLSLSLKTTFLVDALPVNDVTLDIFGPYLVVEKRQEPPSPWTYLRPAAEDAVLHLTVASKGDEKNDLGAKLMDISTPSSTNYGQYLNQQELRDFTAPSSNTIEVIELWLQSASALNSLTYTSDARSYSFDILASDANAMFQGTSTNFFSLSFGALETMRQVSGPASTTNSGLSCLHIVLQDIKGFAVFLPQPQPATIPKYLLKYIKE